MKRILIILLLIGNATALTTDDFFVELISNSDKCFSNCHAEYKFCNPTVYNIPLSSIKYEFQGNVFNFEKKIEKDVIEEYPCLSYSYIEKKNKTYEIIDNKTKEIKNKTEFFDEEINVYSQCQREIKKTEKIKDEVVKYNECVNLKVEGSIKINSQVDWIPYIEIIDKKYTQSKWAWWDSSYDYRRKINTSCFLNNMSYAVNWSNGLCNHTLWGYYNYTDLPIYVYYDSICINPRIATEINQIQSNSENTTIFADYEDYHNTSVFPNTELVYHFESVNPADLSGNGRDGINISMIPLTDGVFDKGLIFDGGAGRLITMPTFGTLMDGSNDWSIEFWIYADADFNDNSYFLSFRGDYYVWCIVDSAADGGTEDGISCGWYGAPWTWVDITSGDLVATTWYHVAWTWNTSDSIHTIYLNGVLKDTAATGNPSAAGEANEIGGARWTGYEWNGKFDELRIYNYVMSINQINTSYANGIKIKGCGDLGIEEFNIPPIIPQNFTYKGDSQLCIIDTLGNKTCLLKNEKIVLNESMDYYFNLEPLIQSKTISTFTSFTTTIFSSLLMGIVLLGGTFLIIYKLI